MRIAFCVVVAAIFLLNALACFSYLFDGKYPRERDGVRPGVDAAALVISLLVAAWACWLAFGG